jgi:hypothetical protein
MGEADPGSAPACQVDVLIDETYAADNNAYTIVDFKQVHLAR